MQEERLRAAINARIGDGYFWKHPECTNYKIIWNSVELDWLEVKHTEFRNLIGTPPRKPERQLPKGALEMLSLCTG